MDKLRRSFRGSFRRNRKEPISAATEASKPHLWQNDEVDVRAGTCYFHVKYLGCVEVFESRGMHVCEEALKVLKNSRRRAVRALLHVSGDGLRVVEDDTKGLIVDQTIEKVSFCAPDRTHDRGFSYICRDGTTRRWMCHGFLALKESGERLSHAVGCAFAVCLERKQKRDKECSVTMKFDTTNSTFTRTGSFHQEGLIEKLQDTTNVNNNVNDPTPIIEPIPTVTSIIPAEIVMNNNNNNNNNNMNSKYNRKENIPVRNTNPKVVDTHAIERPRATISMLQRQCSFRGLSHLKHASPFKRQLSLRLSDLPSNAERTNRSHSLELSSNPSANSSILLMRTPVYTIPELAPVDIASSPANVKDQVSAMCQQLSEGLSILANSNGIVTNNSENIQLNSGQALSARDVFASKVSPCSSQLKPTLDKPSSCFVQNSKADMRRDTMQAKHSSLSVIEHDVPLTAPATPPVIANTELPKPEQWLGQVSLLKLNETESAAAVPSTVSIPSTMKRAPMMTTHNRAYSLSSAETVLNGSSVEEKPKDAFNIDWASLSVDSKSENINTNPFLSNSPLKGASDVSSIKISQVQM